MSRVILLVIMGTWLLGAEQVKAPALVVRPALAVFLGGYVVMVAVVALWARWLSRQALNAGFRRSLWRFNWLVQISRWVIPAWLAFGVLGKAQWAHTVLAVVRTPMHFPPMLLGTLPAMLAWVALWWAEFPADRALREQNLMDELMQGLPVHEPPRLGRYLFTALRQQLLPVILPILLIILFRDVMVSVLGSTSDLVMLPAAALVYLMAPEILKRLFNARRLEDSSLRRRLEEVCRRSGKRYRDILLWQTDFTMANAAVIGILPGWRYVLLSDRLLETMTDEQIEAVFAHELGHIVHHHMAWFIVFFLILALASVGIGEWVDQWVSGRFESDGAIMAWRGLITGAAAFAATVWLMGWLSRRFERQADVFAARMMENGWGRRGEPSVFEGGEVAAAAAGAGATYVGPRGAEVFSSALRRVALVNNIPPRASDIFHPSIARRLEYLRDLSVEPGRTVEFDRMMSRLYAMLLIALVMCGLAAILANQS